MALFVNERTRLPVFVPLAPAKSVVDRLPAEFERVARRTGVDGLALDSELEAMAEWVLAQNGEPERAGHDEGVRARG